MKKIIFLLLLYVASLGNGFAQDTTVHIMPQPVSVKVSDGHFQLDAQTRIAVQSPQLADMADMLSGMLKAATGYSPKAGGSGSNEISLRLNKTANATLGKEGYTLSVTTKEVQISANEPHGIFNALQTLMQLLPPGPADAKTTVSHPVNIPCVNVLDYPRFGWRGLMLDVSRHFFSKEFIKQYIDEMAKYKFDVFHWHLTDDQGWRIEIKGLPKLTEVGAWRVPRTGHFGTFQGPQPGEKATYGGYYTQDDIREIVKYAQQRFVTILPEVDVPAHSLALIASYPNLSCTQLQYPVNPGGGSYGDNVLCVANDSTWLILDKIFTQLASLFPGEYIHVGGDEANRSFWTKDPKDQALMKKEGITDPAGLQSYFEKKLEKLILSKGKKMIGWDEILEGGLAPEAAVMSWRGMNGGIKAAQMGHKVVMTPTSNCYLDYYQGDPLVEPVVGGMLRLSTCYQFEPVPAGVDPKYILGGQGNLWAESVPNYRHAEYMTWPRALALSEVFWSPADHRNWTDFIRRMEWQFRYMDADQVKYSRSTYDAIITGVKDADGTVKVKLATEIPGITIYYTFDGTDPDNFYPKYEGQPLEIPAGTSQIRVITYRDGKPVGRQINCPLSELKNRMEK